MASHARIESKRNMVEPTNAELKQSFDDHVKEDGRFQDETRIFNGEMALFKAETEGSLSALHERLKQIPTREEGKKDIEEVFGQIIQNKGKLAFQLTLSAAALIAAIIVILGGFKTALGWIGFSMISK